MALTISGLSAWGNVPAPSSINDVTLPTATSPAIQSINLNGTFAENSTYYAGFHINLNAGYKLTSIAISTSESATINIGVATDSHSGGAAIGQKVQTSMDLQQDGWELNFDVALSGETTKNYKFRKGGKGPKVKPPKH